MLGELDQETVGHCWWQTVCVHVRKVQMSMSCTYSVHACVHVCDCIYERERGREGGRERLTENFTHM